MAGVDGQGLSTDQVAIMTTKSRNKGWLRLPVPIVIDRAFCLADDVTGSAAGEEIMVFISVRRQRAQNCWIDVADVFREQRIET